MLAFFQELGYGAIALAIVIEWLVVQSSRGAAAARANVHNRTRS